MSVTEQEMSDALDNIDVEQLDDQQSDTVDSQQDQQNETADSKNNQQIDTNNADQKPPGFLSYEEWVEKGKDPADFRGEKAYKAQYESLKEVRELKNSMSQVVDSVETWKKQQNEQMEIQIDQAKVDAAADLEKAKEDEDMSAALAAQEKINKLDNQSRPAQSINPVIADFATKNPIVDSGSTQYNPEFHKDMITIHNNKLDQILGGDRAKASNLTPGQVTRVQNWAFKQAKELHLEKFVSHKNTRMSPTAPRQRASQSKGDVNSRLKSITGNTKNRMDASPANDIYNILKDRDPAAAETFAKNMLGDE